MEPTEVAGLRIAYARVGQELPLVLLHGFIWNNGATADERHRRGVRSEPVSEADERMELALAPDHDRAGRPRCGHEPAQPCAPTALL